MINLWSYCIPLNLTACQKYGYSQVDNSNYDNIISYCCHTLFVNLTKDTVFPCSHVILTPSAFDFTVING